MKFIHQQNDTLGESIFSSTSVISVADIFVENHPRGSLLSCVLLGSSNSLGFITYQTTKLVRTVAGHWGGFIIIMLACRVGVGGGGLCPLVIGDQSEPPPPMLVPSPFRVRPLTKWPYIKSPKNVRFELGDPIFFWSSLGVRYF
jgi:hypothetical protein